MKGPECHQHLCSLVLAQCLTALAAAENCGSDAASVVEKWKKAGAYIRDVLPKQRSTLQATPSRQGYPFVRQSPTKSAYTRLVLRLLHERGASTSKACQSGRGWHRTIVEVETASELGQIEQQDAVGTVLQHQALSSRHASEEARLSQQNHVRMPD